MRTELHPFENRPLTDNERAVMAFLSLAGGYEAFKASGGSFDYLIGLYQADTDNPLSGLREIADHMYLGRNPARKTNEPLLDPNTARTWLLETGQATETESGLELGEKPDHIAISALAIAMGSQARYLSEVYANLPDHPAQLFEQIVAEKAHLIVETIQDTASL